jgi:putative holliday junction resolvase
MVRLLGVDPGTKRCGVAVTNREASMAFPRPALPTDNQLAAALRLIAQEEGVELVVIGRPVALSGNETASTKEADALFAQLSSELAPLPVVQWDERLTTHEAQRSLSAAGLKAKQHRSRVDSAAAVIMLQNYAESHREN